MDILIKARKLANYIDNLESFQISKNQKTYSYTHIGALLTDIVLQAGLNYKNVVLPRVNFILIHYPKANTLSRFIKLIKNRGIESVIHWKHFEKIQRLENIIHLLKGNEIENCSQLRAFLMEQNNKNKLLNIHGFGPKTLDYTLKLLAVDTVAVDRHIYSFLEMADLTNNNYAETKKIVEYAADFLNISRNTMDCSIWAYMSDKVYKIEQTKLEFPYI